MLPALLIGYNRPNHAARVLESMRSAGVRELLVALDGPRPGDKKSCSQTRKIVEAVEWPESLEIRVSDHNQGPGWGPRNAIEWFLDQHAVGIICEDDTLLASDAARFLTLASEDFRQDVPMASATSFGCSAYKGRSDYFASRYATTWGWAVSADAWSNYDYLMADWPKRRSSGWLAAVGGSRNFSEYWTNIFDMTYADRDHYWDYQWQYAMWRQGWNCWHPRVNLATNIGFDAAATHTRSTRRGLTSLPAGKLRDLVVRPDSTTCDHKVDGWIDRHVYETRRSIKGRMYRAIFG